MSKRIVIGTRGSKLALFQANLVKSLLYKHNPDLRIEIKIIKTKGDVILDSPLAKIGDKGLFTKEIEMALLTGEIDLAVHSLKDLPTRLPEGLRIGAVLEREDPRDAFVSFRHNKFSELPENAVLATSSLRRRATLLHYRPDLNIVDVRGNVDTRLRKLKENGWDGMILAAAGLRRLGLTEVIRELLSAEQFLPAVGQGALAVEIREDDSSTLSEIAPLHHEATYSAVLAERAFLRRLEGGCQIPIGAHATADGGHVILRGFVADLSGQNYFSGEQTGPAELAEEIGTRLAEQLLNQGAEAVLKELLQRGNEK
jgi:hydroxymethylbilane synthase